jgi:hypothetical protein
MFFYKYCHATSSCVVGVIIQKVAYHAVVLSFKYVDNLTFFGAPPKSTQSAECHSVSILLMSIPSLEFNLWSIKDLPRLSKVLLRMCRYVEVPEAIWLIRTNTSNETSYIAFAHPRPPGVCWNVST